MRAPENYAPAPLSHQRPVELAMIRGVIEKDARKLHPVAGRIVVRPNPRGQLLPQRVTQLFEATDEQVVLVVEVGVETGPADVGPVDHVLDRHVVGSFLQDRGEQRFPQQSAGSAHTPVVALAVQFVSSAGMRPYGCGTLSPTGGG